MLTVQNNSFACASMTGQLKTSVFNDTLGSHTATLSATKAAKCSACSNLFKPDSLFCRKCGHRRELELCATSSEAYSQEPVGFAATPDSTPMYTRCADSSNALSRVTFGLDQLQGVSCPDHVVATPEQKPTSATSYCGANGVHPLVLVPAMCGFACVCHGAAAGLVNTAKEVMDEEIELQVMTQRGELLLRVPRTALIGDIRKRIAATLWARGDDFCNFELRCGHHVLLDADQVLACVELEGDYAQNRRITLQLVALGAQCVHQIRDQLSDEVGKRTTLHISFTNLVTQEPDTYLLRDEFMALLDTVGFARMYDFIFVPFDFGKREGMGYGLVNFTSRVVAATAHQFLNRRVPNERTLWTTEANGSTGWARNHGFFAHAERYRNSDLLHADVPDLFKPVLLLDGVRVAFPPPSN